MSENEKSPDILAGVQGASFVGSHSFVASDFDFTSSATLSQLYPDELEQKFIPKKKASLLLSDSYFRLDDKKRAHRVHECGSFLEFGFPILSSGGVGDPKLKLANFCYDRLCPMCGWRREKKIFSQVSAIMDQVYKDYRFIFLTLTVPNCQPDDLSFTITYLMESWARFVRQKRFKTSVKGYFRALEVTRNKKNGSFHPHFHCILAVPLTFTLDRSLYIPHAEWLDMWRRAAKDVRITMVNVKFIRPRAHFASSICDQHYLDAVSAAVSEVAKYTVKSSHYLFEDSELTDFVVSRLASALRGRRLVHLGGIFREVAKKLKLDDMENGDLLNIDGEEIREDLQELIVAYSWGIGCYKVSGFYKKGV